MFKFAFQSKSAAQRTIARATMYIPSIFALVIDFLATMLCQAGYVIQKKGHQSVESHNVAVEDVK